MSIQPKKKISLICKGKGFDYSVLAPELEAQAKEASAFIVERVKQNLQNVVLIGMQLHEMRRVLPHGHFGRWTKEEFGWSPTTEANYRAVADWLADKFTIIVDLPIAPTAAYRLAATSTPEEAREEALQRARAGEEITNALAVAIIEEAGLRNGLKRKLRAPHRVLGQLTRDLADCQEVCPEDRRAEVARQLRV